MSCVIDFDIVGRAYPAGSKTAHVPLHPKTKQPYRVGQTDRVVVNMAPACKETEPWMRYAAEKAREVYQGELLDEPLCMIVTFYRPRLSGHFGTGRNAGKVKASAPPFPATTPDVTKLVRAIEDAFTGVLWRDDSRVVTSINRKRWDTHYHVRITVCQWTKELEAEVDPHDALLATLKDLEAT